MSSKRRRKPSLQALISRKQRIRIIAMSRLKTIAIQVAAFGQTKKKPLPRAAPARLSPPLMEGSEWPCKLLWIVIRNFVLEDGARRPPSYLKMAFLGAGGRCIFD